MLNKTLIIALATVLILFGCGYKGPLYLPGKGTAQGSSPFDDSPVSPAESSSSKNMLNTTAESSVSESTNQESSYQGGPT